MCYVYGVADGVGSSAVGASSAAPPRRLAASGVCQSLSVVMSCKSSASYSRLRTVVREDQTAEEVRRYAATPASPGRVSAIQRRRRLTQERRTAGQPRNKNSNLVQ